MKTIEKTIDAADATSLREKFAKFEKKAKQWGVTGISLSISEPRWEERVDVQFDPETGERWEIKTLEHLVDVVLVAPVIRSVEGWTFRAIVEWHIGEDKKGQAVVIAASGEGLLPTRPSVNVCDHCGKRRSRAKTFLVESPEGDIRQVGTACVKAYTGIDPESLLRFIAGIEKLDEEIDEDFCGGGRRQKHFRPDEILKAAARVVAKNGFVSHREAEEKGLNATSSIVALFLDPLPATPTRGSWRKPVEITETYPFSPEAEKIYNLSVEAIREIGAGVSAYEQTIAQLWALEGVNAKRVGYLASAITLGLRKANKKAQEAASEFAEPVVAVGQKVEIEAEVVFSTIIEGYYGATTIIKFKQTVDGVSRLFTWFASGGKGVQAGEKYHVKGTVKEIQDDPYAKAKSASLTRCKLVAA